MPAPTRSIASPARFVAEFTPPDDLDALFRAKVESSGITPEQARALGMSVMTAAETLEAGLWRQGLPALRIPYFNPATGQALTAAPCWPQFYRARCLRLPAAPPKGFAKYLQPPNSGACAYFPPVPTLPWPAILGDPSQMLLITEGELKAAKACLEGFPTIGLGGVYSFRSRAPYCDFLPELEAVSWAHRTVYVVYDSDIRSNRDVARAAWALTEELVRRGALPYLAVIPAASDKAGLDDFLVANGAASLDQMLADARPVGASPEMWALNDQFAVLLEGDGEVVEVTHGERIKRRQLEFRLTKHTSERRVKSDGTVSHDLVNIATAWLGWPMRREVRKLAYEPEHPPLTEIPGRYGPSFNTWRGLACASVEGDASPFYRLIDHLFAGAVSTTRTWFLDWLAYPLQHLGAKLFSAVVLHGLVHGSGKTLVGETMKRIYGDAYAVIGQRELKSEFNEWSASKSFIMGDDITGLDRLEIHDAVKVMITRSTVRINTKYLSTYDLDDHVNWLFTSNRANAFYLDIGDRRFFVWEVPAAAGKLPRAFYCDYMHWLDHGGAGHLLHSLLQRDLSAFDPGDAAPETAAKRKMREEARSDVANWVEDLTVQPDDLLRVGDTPLKGDLFSTRQLVLAYCSQSGADPDDRQISARMGAALASADINQVNNRRPVFLGAGHPSVRYYAVRNRFQWLDATLAEVQAHLRSDGRAMPSPAAAGATASPSAPATTARRVALRAKKY